MFKNPHFIMKYLLIVLAAAFAMPSMAEEDAPKRMTSAEKKAALLEKYDTNKDGKLDPATASASRSAGTAQRAS